jgi:L-aminopeptidase/D-esterase-like protein
VAGVPVGREIPGTVYGEDTGSIIIVVATDAPLLPHQLKRIARRATMGLARTGSVSGNGSGDIFIAFSTANPGAWTSKKPVSVSMVPNDDIGPLFEGTVEAVEEAIVNAMVASDTMTGINGNRADGLPHDRLRAALEKYNRLVR